MNSGTTVTNRKKIARQVTLLKLSCLATLLALFSACSSGPAPAPAIDMEAQSVVQDFLVSKAANRSGASVLDTSAVAGRVYIFTAQTTGVNQVEFYLDDVKRSGTPYQVEQSSPYDLAGGSSSANALDTSTLSEGMHTVTARIRYTSGSEKVPTATFVVDNSGKWGNSLLVSSSPDRGGAKLLASSSVSGKVYVFFVPTTSLKQVSFYLDNTSRSGTPAQTERIAFYDFAGTASAGRANAFDTSTLKEGQHNITAAILTSSGQTQVVSAGFTVGVGDASPPDPQPDPRNARLGLHFTEQELALWRTRAQNGPYRVAGDVSQNSPGDWERIMQNANSFLQNPGASAWDGPAGENCFTRDQVALFVPGANLVRDAAFVYLVEQAPEYRDAVRAFLLDHASKPKLDLGNRRHWCLGVQQDANFSVANWFTTMLFAYDYLGEESFSSTENQQLGAWFLVAADFFQIEVDSYLGRLYLDRMAGKYQLTAYATGDRSRVTHYGGWITRALHRYYNNRKGSAVRFYGLVGIKFDRSVLKDSAKLFVKEFIKFSVFPDGIMGEYERWRSDFPDLGWGYASTTLGSLITIADAFARTGDMDLYTFHTSDGALGTEGGDKSLWLPIQTLLKLADGSKKLYGTDQSSNTTDAYLIDGIHKPYNWYGTLDIIVLQANAYYNNSYLKAMYTRTTPTLKDYPQYPASVGPNPVWMGEGGVYPGILFMFGLAEEIAPY